MLPWVENEIEKSLRGEPNAKNVYDLAALLIVREYLAAPPEPVQAESTEKEKAPKVYLSDYCTDLNKRPTLEQAEKALAAVAIEDREQLKRAKDMRTWAPVSSDKNPDPCFDPRKRNKRGVKNSKTRISNRIEKPRKALCLAGFHGTPSGTRTLDTLIKSQVLYQLS